MALTLSSALHTPSLLAQQSIKEMEQPTPSSSEEEEDEAPTPDSAPAASAADVSAAADFSSDNPNQNSNHNALSDSIVKKQLLQTPSQYASADRPPPQDSALRHFADLATTPGLTPGSDGFDIFGLTPRGFTPGNVSSASGILKPSTYSGAASISTTSTNTNDNTRAAASSSNMAAAGLQWMVPQSEMKSTAELAARKSSDAFFRANGPSSFTYDHNATPFVTKVSNDANDDENGKVSASSLAAPALSSSSSAQPPMLKEFPFVFDGYAGWVCRHCSHFAYYYRGPNYVWKSLQPPPNLFVDQHLVYCPGLNPAIASNVEAIRNATQSKSEATPMATTSELRRKQEDPPTGRSPQRTSSSTSSSLFSKPQDDLHMHLNTATKEQAMWSYQWNTFQQQPSSQVIHPGIVPPQGFVSTHSHFMQQTNDLKRKSSPTKIRIAEEARAAIITARVAMKLSKPHKHKSLAGIPCNDEKYNHALDLLSARADAIPKATNSTSDIGTILVDEEDSELLTDYFYHMMMQLVVCRFSDRDRKTRGGKRDNIPMGYGGLQCIHCSTNDYSRKFYWSTVDRLANSFAEIPSHILKCKSCPSDVRNALLVLKARHPTQMSLRPRGSQKVFFRRVWRRLHRRDIDATGKASSPPFMIATSVDANTALKSPEATSGTAEQVLMTAIAVLPPKNERVVLALPQDKDWLSDMDCFVRSIIEIFSASENDLVVARTDKKYPIKLGQVGLRCIHCAGSDEGARLEAVMYPYSVSGIYESVRDFQHLHLDYCPHLPEDLKSAMSKLSHGCSSLSSVLRRYYVQAARALGLFDSEDGGIRAGGTVIPMMSSGFSTTASDMNRKRSCSSPVTDDNTMDQAVSKRRKIGLSDEV